MSTLRHHARRSRIDESGISLIEMLVSILILGVALSAFASVLITTLQTTTRNEQNVTATAVAQQFVEQLQATPWDDAALYEDEIDDPGPDMTRWRARIDVSAQEFEGDPLILLPGPGATRPAASVTPADPPLPTEQASSGGLTFNIDRYITFIDRDGQGGVDTRRFTAFVSWTDRFGQFHEVRFDSERAPTREENTPTFDGLRVLYFFVTPDPVNLDPVTAKPTEDVQVLVRTNKPTTSGQLTWESVDVDESTDPDTLTRQTNSMSMTGSELGTLDGFSGFTKWTATVDKDLALEYFNGTVEFGFAAANANPTGDPASGERTVTYQGGPYEETDLVGGPGPTPTPTPTPSPSSSFPAPTGPVDIVHVLRGTSVLCATSNKQTLTQDFTLDIRVNGFPVITPTLTDNDVDGNVYATFTKRSSKNGPTTSVTVPATFLVATGGNTDWRLTVPTGTAYFKPGDVITFVVQAERASDLDDDFDSSTVVTVGAGC